MKATTENPPAAPRNRRRLRAMVISLAFMLLAAMVLPLSGYVYTALVPGAHAQSADEANPRANYWRAVREGTQGYSAVRGPEAGVLIQNGGQNWRSLRNGPVANYGGYVLGAGLAAVVLFFLVRGRIKLDKPRTGRKVKRWNAFERLLHWTNAALFVLLGITGLSLLFGRAVLIPVLGPRGFAAWAEVAKNVHNYLGPLFVATLAIMVLMWIWHNLPGKGDLDWFLKGGGLIGKGHPHAGRMNAGEKVWFWIIVVAGGAVAVSGLVMNFPNWGYPREVMQLANLVHASLAMLWMAVFLGHAYIGTLGTEGSLEAMTTGYVDETWAAQHHDLWLDEVRHRQGAAAGADDDATGMTPQRA